MEYILGFIRAIIIKSMQKKKDKTNTKQIQEREKCMLELADEKEKIKSVLKAMFPWLCPYRQQLSLALK